MKATLDMIFDLIQNTPLFGLYIATLLLLFIAFEGGVFLGKRHRLISEPKDRSPIGSIVAATLGLLAFLLAFTFGIAASKFDERRMLVVEEANAIGTTLLRTEYLPDPYRIEITNLLKEYVSTRLDALNPGNLEKGIKKSEALQDRIWQQAVEIAKSYPNAVVYGRLIQSLNEMIDLHTKRVNVGMHIRIPLVIWIALFFVTILAIGSVGYQIGLIQAHYLGISLLLILTFSSVIVLIADLDRPQEGYIKVSQQSLIDLVNKFNKKEA
jgi:hypothetical protein